MKIYSSYSKMAYFSSVCKTNSKICVKSTIIIKLTSSCKIVVYTQNTRGSYSNKWNSNVMNLTKDVQ